MGDVGGVIGLGAMGAPMAANLERAGYEVASYDVRGGGSAGSVAEVAARATQHYLISKDVLDRGQRVATRVRELKLDRRRDEIARMLAGAEITQEARAAAERLIRAAC